MTTDAELIFLKNEVTRRYIVLISPSFSTIQTTFTGDIIIHGGEKFTIYWHIYRDVFHLDANMSCV